MALARRHAYLQALGIDPWVLRVIPASAKDAQVECIAGNEQPVSPYQGLQIGPGDGDILLICHSPAEAATKLAGDIARCLDSEPVWGWIMPADMGPGLSLHQAIQQRLFTRVLVFGKQLGNLATDTAGEFSGQANAEVIASARILYTTSIPELEGSPAAKKALWSELCANNWCAARARNA